MKIKLVFWVILFSCFLINYQSLKAENDIILYFLKTNNLLGFVQDYCNNDEELAINKLMSFSIDDTVNASYAWYYDTNVLLNFLITNPRIPEIRFTSQKLKTYSWILLIYENRTSAKYIDWCGFYKDSLKYTIKHWSTVWINDLILPVTQEVLFTIKIAELETIPFDYGTWTVTTLKDPEQFIRLLSYENHKLIKVKDSEALKYLEQSFNNWHLKMQQKGLQDLRDNNIRPWDDKKYRFR